MDASAWPCGWAVRAPDPTDIHRVVEMLNARSRKLHGENQVSRESVQAWWKSPRLRIETDMRLVLDAQGTVAAMVFVDHEGETYANLGCTAMIHPRYEGRANFWDELHTWGLNRAAELMPRASKQIRVTATAQAASQDTHRRAALERAGFAPVRVENHMCIDLAPPLTTAEWPAGVSVRTTDIAADLNAIVTVYLEAWRDHWGFVTRPLADVLATFVPEIETRCGTIDPSLWFLAIENKDVVGISLCIAGTMDDPAHGYVYELGVRPAWRRRGIALALLRHTFAEFHRRGYVAVELDVDSQSLTGALRVYERAGMHVVRRSISYEKELRPGIDLATRELSP